MFLFVLILSISSIERAVAHDKRNIIRRDRIPQFRDHNPFRKNITRKLFNSPHNTQKSVVEESDDLIHNQNDRSKIIEKLKLDEQEPESKFIASHNKDNRRIGNRITNKLNPDEKIEKSENTEEKSGNEPETSKKLEEASLDEIFDKMGTKRPKVSKPGYVDIGDPPTTHKHIETKDGEITGVSKMPTNNKPFKPTKANSKGPIIAKDPNNNDEKEGDEPETSSESTENKIPKSDIKLNTTKEGSSARNNNTMYTKTLPEGKLNNFTKHGIEPIKDNTTALDINIANKTEVSDENVTKLNISENNSTKTEVNETNTTNPSQGNQDPLKGDNYRDPSQYDFYDDDDMIGPGNFKFGFFGRRDKNGNLICGANAFSPDNQSCQCTDSFPEGNPYDSSGCYKCDKKCSLWAGCYRDNTCRCMYGFKGNGTFCESEYVKLERIEPVKGRKLNITFTFQSDSELDTLYCKFDSTIVRGYDVTSNNAICDIPAGVDSRFAFAISKNPTNFEQDNTIYDIPKKENMRSRKKMGIIFIISMVVVSIFLSNTKQPKKQLQRKIVKELPKPGEDDVEQEQDPTTMKFNDVQGTIDDIENIPNDENDDADEESVYSQPIDTNIPPPADVEVPQQPQQPIQQL
ncbi:hypothetical protein TVAG_059150 [Trichomonas vaginalis G3]|uniref:EGF-like domain-containing protein n=1 Tax=Trichomonas vaginalis (strain ATCC PRA-98 / G3) TaxID=412133 RepID=A2ERJ0_TRIV3|nr:hypothetical protein TVAGG3_0284840 [Trichomonas vaginalis G3]EAY04717.1 hypothetical protein TVAG_059150 [Trichomonas vaginalis G3]KAI5526815.1 hypothetical protein TVAGG3_0284840 [Trichomonas vaginalis G3]|eukprot:XP_001316940.1 hypothetical protein [Trichomonas vaginalis G3]